MSVDGPRHDSEQPLLKVSGLKVAYGGIQAVKGVELRGARGRTGQPDRRQRRRQDDHAEGHHRHCSRSPPAQIEFLGQPIKGQGAWDLVKQGLVMVPEGRGTFTRMTITENLQMGAFVRNDGEIDADIDKVFAHLPAPEGTRAAAGRHDVAAASSRCWRWAAR